MAVIRARPLPSLVAFCAAAWLAPPAGAVDTLRCGRWIVEEDMTMAEVESKCVCGAPDYTEIERVPVRGRSRSGASIELGETTIVRWTYERGRRLGARLTFEEGRVERIELLTKP